MFKHLSIKTRLAWSFGIILALSLTALAVSLFGMHKISSRTDNFFQNDYARQTAYQEMFSQGLLSGVALRNLVLKPALTKPYKVVPAAIAKFDAALNRAKQLSAGDTDTLALLDQVAAKWAPSKAAKLEVLQLMKDGKVAAATQTLATREHPPWQKVRIAVQKLFERSVVVAKDTRTEVLDESRSMSTISMVLGAIALVIGILVAWLNLHSVRTAFGSIITSMTEIASGEGDLTRRLKADTNNEMGQMARAFNTFVDKIQSLVREVAGSIEQVSNAARDMTQVSNTTRSGFEQQLVEIEQVATAMNEMTATVHDVAQNAVQASDAASQADSASAEGNQVVREVVQSINDLASEINDTAAAIQALHNNSEQIGSVLDVIKGIAEQTNLLALNAAIEAARAGEQGRGFAVVADEVRTLASRTQESTQEIQDTIEKLQAGAKAAVQAMERGKQSASDSVDKAGHAGTSLDGITAEVSRIAQMNNQIAVAAEEQSAVAENINRSIASATELASDATGNAEHIATAAHDLEALAEQLERIAGGFRV
jgi:methyl-accepting chemotaxis protein